MACEAIDLPPVPLPPPADLTGPELGLSRATLRKRRLSLPVSCAASESRCAGSVALTAVGKRDGKKRRVKLGSITVSLDAGEQETLTTRLSRGERRALKRLRKLRLKVALDVQDAAGNRTVGSERVALRR